VTPDAALDPLKETQPTQPPSTAGMTTKVVKGSMWTLAGSVLPLAVSFISTPFIIRFLGAESYGVLLLVGLIPTYFSFADFGMGVASTKFSSEAYGEGDSAKEAAVVWTATAVAFITSIIIALPILIFSFPIILALNVPEPLQMQASVALKIAAAGFVIGIVASVLNSPMLARLRMDLNTVTNAVPKILLAAVTPFLLYAGAGIVGAVSWAFIVGVATLAVVFYFSGRLLPTLFHVAIRREYLKSLLNFGGGLVIGGIAAMLLINFEKLALTRMVSVKALAYYSVAFTFANMATIFGQAMVTSLIPAFSQLTAPANRTEFNGLFARGMRLNLILLVPALMVLIVIAKPFFTLWAGEEFGHESSLPFYILAFGLFFNILAYIPLSTIIAFGRTDIFAKLYWIELAVYAIAAIVLINYFGIAGAAAAWSLRVIIDAFVIMWLSGRVGGVDFGFVRKTGGLIIGAAILAPVMVAALAYDNYSLWLLPGMIVSLAAYSLIIWNLFVRSDERVWLRQTALNFLKIQ
jgi:O-antigen/teichoic acid export membrane protein